jgi:hypothetical protein
VEEEKNTDRHPPAMGGKIRRACRTPTIGHREEEKGSPTMRMRKRGVEQQPCCLW